MITPPYLKKGDSIAIVATAKRVSKEEMEPAINIFKEWGLKVVLGKSLFKGNGEYFATDEQRKRDLQQALDDKNVKAIIGARGGYGTIRIIDSLNFNLFKKSPKWIIGYSDITVLHSHIHKNYSTSTIHSAMPIGFPNDQESVNTLKNNLFGSPVFYSLQFNRLNRRGNAMGEVVGGNLSLLYALQGSKSDINTNEKILFIEDVGEYLYHIDRMMISLKRSGKLSKIKALIVGGLTEMKETSIPFGRTAEEIILDITKEFNYPVCFGFPAGHGEKNLAFPLGRKAKLNIAEKVEISFL